MASTMFCELFVVTATSFSSLKSHLAKLSLSSPDRLTAVCSVVISAVSRTLLQRFYFSSM